VVAPNNEQPHDPVMNTRAGPLLILLSLPCSVTEFVPGAICANLNPTAPGSQMLQGRHVRVYDMVWEPYAIKNEESASGWSGYDIDLLDALAQTLGFSYEVLNMGYPNSSIGGNIHGAARAHGSRGRSGHQLLGAKQGAL
jgi:hypothetical protein